MNNILVKDFLLSKINNVGALCSFLNNPKNVKYLEYLNSIVPTIHMTISEKLWYFSNNTKELQLCICGNMKKYIGPKNGYRQSCGDKKCYISIRKNTNIEKYGVDNPQKLKEVVQKTKETVLTKYGKHYMYDNNVREKFNKTMMERYGVEWAQQNNHIKSKSINTWNNNENKEAIIKNRRLLLINKSNEEKQLILLKKHITKMKNFGSIESYNKHFKLKFEKTCIEKYGVKHHLSNKEIIGKRVQSYKNNITEKIGNNTPEGYKFIDKKENKNNTDCVLTFLCNKCNIKFNINRQYFVFRMQNNIELCLICNPILSGISHMEISLLEFISCNYSGKIIKNIKTIINPFELDIYLPELNLAIEFNGLYWHSEEYKDNNYHLNKTELCNNKGIQLIHIWEDDWLNKQDIIKSIILNNVGKSDMIYISDYQIKEINNNFVIEKFLNNNHINGFIKSDINIGLYYNDELVSLISFSKMYNTYELLRFCDKLNTVIIDSTFRLFEYFIDNYKPLEIIAYSDYSISNGHLYKKLGFILNNLSKPIIQERNSLKLFNCGFQKFIFKN